MRARARILALLAAALSLPAPGVLAAPPAGYQPPAPVVRTLANGLTVAVFPDDRMPITQFQLLVPAGAAHEPPGHAGVANLTVQSLTHGTASRTALDFANAVDALGGTLGTAAALEFSTVSGSFLAADLEAGLELLADAVVNPLFSEDELPAVKGQIGAALARTRQMPATLADEHLWAVSFPGHPYGHSPQGAVRTLNALGPGQVRAFYRERYRPNRAILAIAGDVTPERAFRAAEDALGSWGGRTPEWRAAPPPAPAKGWRVRIVDTPGLGRAELRLGTPGPARGAQGYEALMLAGEVLEGLAPETGLRSSVVGLRDGGLVSIATGAPVDSVGAQVARLRAVLTRWAVNPAPEGPLAAARRRLVGGYTLRFETFAGQIAQWMSSTLGETQPDAVAGFPRRVAALDASDLRAAMSRWIAPDRMALVVVGPADRLRPQLESLGPVEVVSAEAAAEVLEAPSTATQPPTAEQLARGRALTQQAIAAHGGLDRLRRIQDSRLEGDLRMSDGTRELSGQVIQLRKEPMRFAFTTTFENVRSMQVLDGDHAWATVEATPAQYDDLDSLARAGLRAGFRSDLQHLLVAAADTTARVAWRGQERVAEQDADVVEVVARDGDRRILFLDPASHRVVAMEQNEAGHSARRHYYDFRDVNGVLWPFGEDRLLDGQRMVALTLRNVAFNIGLKDDQFRKPGQAPQEGRRPRPR